MADRAQARFLSNRPTTARVRLEHGIYGLSNGALDEPWPKTTHLKACLLDWIVAGATGPETLLEALAIETLPDVGLRPPEPSDAPQEPQDSPIFIRNPVYGTRCSTVVAIDAVGQGVMFERRFGPDGEPAGDTRLTFAWRG
jgi:uncharacterized protein with NRDE domain